MTTGEVGADPAAAVGDLVEHMATRLRRLGRRHWREALGPAGESAADLVYRAVEWCAQREAQLDPVRLDGAPAAPARPAYDAALADQLAVVGRDLALALAAHGDRAPAEQVMSQLEEYARVLKIAPPS